MAWKLPPDQNVMGGVYGSQDAAPYQLGDFQRSGPQMKSTGILESLMGAFDTQKPWGVGDTVNAALMAIPGMRMGPRGASPAFAAEKGGSPMPQAGEAASPLIAEYGQRLKQALGNREAWEPLMKELQADPRVDLPNLVRISSDFYGGIPKGSSRAKAIDNIQKRHTKLTSWKDELDSGVLK